MFPAARASARPSLAPLIILLASLLLAGLLALISWRNYHHEENLRERFLRQQGQTLIRSFEAGARAGMRMRWREGGLKTLVEESVRENEIAYIVIIDGQGTVQAVGGSWAAEMTLPLGKVIASDDFLTRMTSDSMGKPVYELSRKFRPRWAGRHHGPGMMERMRPDGGVEDREYFDNPPPDQAIFVGIYTSEFEQARLDSLRQNILLGGLLLLVGTAGFYLLFLSQRNRITSSTLETMELYAASLIEGMPAGLLSLDADQKILAVNTQTLEMLGRSQQEVVGGPLAALNVDGDFQQYLTEHIDFIEQPFTWLTAEQKPLPLRISASRLMNAAGELIGTVLILRDMRELQAMEEQLERSRRHSALGVMATGVAHEIRNPLGTLRGFAQYFQRSTQDEKAREYAGLMISEVDRLNRVISALLQFARPREADIVSLETQTLCERVRILMTDEAAAGKIDLRIDCHEGPETIFGDFDLLLQMLLNLLQNALEASQPGSKVDMTVLQKADMVEIRISDQGCGIDPEARAAIFDPFFTTRKNGTGLGLAIVSQIVEQHHGEIAISSTPGQGTEFTIRLQQQAKV